MPDSWDLLKARIVKAINAAQRPGERVFINKTGNLVSNLTSTDLADRLAKYAEARRLAVARVMVLGEVLRDTEAVERAGVRADEVSPTGAFWQLFKGTDDYPACHTTPALLTFNGHLPTLIARSADVPAAGQLALQVRLVETFGHCVLMPRFVNRVDLALDDSLGGPALAEAMQLVLTDPTADARDGTRLFLDRLREVLPALSDQDPAALVRVLGYLDSTSAGPPANPTLDPEGAIADRMDDSNHQYLAALERVARSDPPAQAVEQFRVQVGSEVKPPT